MKQLIRLISFLLLIFLLPLENVSQNVKKQIEALRISTPPKMDGLLNEEIWQSAPVATDFFQNEPFNDRKAEKETVVRILYDDDALYVGAMMYDSSPDSILTELGFRDSEELNADFFAIEISTFNDGINAVGFSVTASGVQYDAKYYNDDFDGSWNAVWTSKVAVIDDGWSAELKVPYSALRFPEKDEQTWGFNIWRSIRRTREIDSWNFVDKKISGQAKQEGEIIGLKNIKPPLRLSFTPYVSGYVEKNASNPDWDYSFKYGMDLKYGINESFTLDMTLIPDFGQVQSDDEIYNLSPFEVYYEEKRPFFTEGTELFQKGGIFYSRRVGSIPDGYSDVEDSLREGESITENPSKTNLINATKLSGRTNKGLGIGVFNAMSAPTHATVSDSSGNLRDILTQPFTNYNMVVFDQNLKNNSSVSFYNTNVYKGKNSTTANVSGTEFQLFNKSSSYSVYGLFNLSQQYSPVNPTDLGFSYAAKLMKVSGNFQFTLLQYVESDTYNPNDLGYLQANNEVSNSVVLEYNIYEPFGKIIQTNNELTIWRNSLYAPRTFTDFGVFVNNMTTFVNYLSVGGEILYRPLDQYDYYEARTKGRVFVKPPMYEINAWISPDYRKPFIIDGRVIYSRANGFDQSQYFASLSPRFRVNDKLTFKAESGISVNLNDIGYVDDVVLEGSDEIVFGRRDLQTVENVLQATYIFSNKIALDLRMRHYWLMVDYDKYYLLDDEGYLNKTDYAENNDFNFNAFNVDMLLRWEFAPGSELAFAWKNAILTKADNLNYTKYFDNLKNTLELPADNSLSLKFLYYLDYQYLKRKNKAI